MRPFVIHEIEADNKRFLLQPGEGSDSMHSNPHYSFAVTRLRTRNKYDGVGLVLTLGSGNELVCEAIRLLSHTLEGREIEDVMHRFGETFRPLADHPQLRWLGPHKGVVHLALASITNACFDLWSKARRVPLWKLLLDLSPEEIVKLCDFSYLEDVLSPDQAIELHHRARPSRDQAPCQRQAMLPRIPRGPSNDSGL